MKQKRKNSAHKTWVVELLYDVAINYEL